MIFYFSGVGNSKYVAEQLSAQLNEQLCFIPSVDVSNQHFDLGADETLGFVFPTYGWGVPTFVETFIRHIQIKNVGYLWMVTTCGDDTGQTYEIFRDDVAQRGWQCSAAWAVQMPESYICLPGFDVDKPAKEKRKIQASQARISDIAKAIANRQTGMHDTIPGPLPWAKSHIVRPFFNSVLITPRPFKANDQCIACQKCAKVCPYDNISMVSTTKSGKALLRPKWGKECVLCLRCYHSCPQHAIHWGIMTRTKGQYLFVEKMLKKNNQSQSV